MDFGFWQTTCVLLVPGILLASWIDYSQRRVPNWLNAALLALGFAAQGFFHGSTGLTTAFLGMLTGFGLLIIPWMMHGMGAGDVKLMAAIGAWLGATLTLYSFFVGAILGGVAAVVMIVSSGRLRMACANMGEFGSAKSFGSTSQLLPYGVPLTAGTLVVLGFRMLGW
jgi:prepilin peptidase CpaA